MPASGNGYIPQADVERFIRDHGRPDDVMSTPTVLAGPARRGELAGRSMLDVRTRLGEHCIAAARAGATRVVGLVPDRYSLQQARALAREAGVDVEYRIAHPHHETIDDTFDIVLCADVLHRIRNPLDLLYRLAADVSRERLIVTDTVVHPQAARGDRPSLCERVVGRRRPRVHVGPHVPTADRHAFAFTGTALRRVLGEHMKCFPRIDLRDDGPTGRYLLDCHRLVIDHLLIVAGGNSSGKTTLCKTIQREALTELPGAEGFGGVPILSPRRIWHKPLEQRFPDPHVPRCLFHYDLQAIERAGLDCYADDPSLDLLRCARRVDVVLAAPERDVLEYQLAQAEAADEKPGSAAQYAGVRERYDRPGYLAALYTNWIDYIESRLRGERRYTVYGHRDGEHDIRMADSATEATDILRARYGRDE